MSLRELHGFQKLHPLRELSINGHNWSLRESGHGEPVLLMLPGAQGTADLYYKVVELMAPLHIVLVTPPAIPDPSQLALDLALLLDALDFERVHLLGAALFGYVLQLLPARQALRIETLFLCNSFCDSRSLQAVHPSLAEIERTPPSAVLEARRAAIEALPDPQYASFKSVARELVGTLQSPKNLHSRVLASLRAVPTHRSKTPDSRIVVIDCPDDMAVALQDRLALRQRYQQAEHFAVEAGGHYPAVLAPGPFADIILARLQLCEKSTDDNPHS